MLDELRSVKSPREVALVRRASQLAGLAVLEAMRSTRPGAWEYQLEAAARYVFAANGARLDGYRAITASGTANIWNGHYYRNDSQLRDGDLVLMDYAPDYRYYVSDIGRMWPVSGRYAAWQRELLQFVLEWRNAVLPRIRPARRPTPSSTRPARPWRRCWRGPASRSPRTRRRRARCSRRAAGSSRTPSA